MIYSAISFSSTWFLVSETTEYPITGKIDGFIFSTIISMSGGRLLFILAICDSTCCLSRSMSEPHSKYADISQLPIVVALLTRLRCSTLFMASSSGLVTSIIILSTGCSPLSAIILILGNVTLGNNDVFKFLYERAPPASIRSRITAIGVLSFKNIFSILFYNTYYGAVGQAVSSITYYQIVNMQNR